MIWFVFVVYVIAVNAVVSEDITDPAPQAQPQPRVVNKNNINVNPATTTVPYPYPFWDPKLSWDVRLNDLMSRLTDEEIVLQLSKGGAGKYGGPAPAIERLGIPPYQWNTECLRGDAEAPGRATAFPQAIGLAAAFSPDLIFWVANATAYEVRAKHNSFIKNGTYVDHTGLSCFSPVINIMRHPLWGRNQETYGEDPFLSGVYAERFVAGLQGKHSRYINANAGCKHFDAHNGPEDIPVSRLSFNAKVSMRDWRLTYLPQFEACVKAGTYSVMCSYNRINGVPACANKQLLTNILRKEWGFSGYVVSDEGAIENIIVYHKYLNNSLDTAVACINAGTNLELSGNKKDSVYTYLSKALVLKRVSREKLVERVKPLFYTRMRLGQFDPPSMNPYAKLDMSVVDNKEHRQLAETAAVKSFVLLKNTENFLPLKKKFKSIAIVGPMANNSAMLFGSYSPNTKKRYVSTPLQGLSSLAEDVKYEAGCSTTPCKTYNSKSIISAVQDAELTVLCLGTGVAVETENHDRPDMELPGRQNDILNDVLMYSAGDVILLLFTGGPIDIAQAIDHEKVRAIFQCSFPAQATGKALYRTLTGSDANPAGRLPYTWYHSLSQVPPMVDYSMKNRTYRYFEGYPARPFGYGLSYTIFHYSRFLVHFQDGNLHTSVMIENTGEYDGDEVVQMYVSWLDEPSMPQRQLVAFDRIFISKGVALQKIFILSGKQLAVWDDKHGFIHKKGTILLTVGGQQPDQTCSLPSNVLKLKVTLPWI